MALELLSPAGSPEALRAAVQSGCGAVYLGWGNFNARRSAKNFSDEEFADAIRYCHLRSVRVFLTLNTLLTDRELPLALDAARTACRLGVDSVLVQDWGLFALLREALPDLPLHASTQMSVFTAGGANEVYGDGCERVVIARECSREDTAAICKACPAEIEIFGHGALCMCYSGQCFFSSVIGGRSGNRGLCAQPCRLKYGWGNKADGSPLSLKDMSLAGHLRELRKMGVACVKIEGRMKTEIYIATVVGAYRRAMDAYAKSPAGYRADAALQARLRGELDKISHRVYDTGFYFGQPKVCGEAVGVTQEAEYMGYVLDASGGEALVEMKNRFFVGDELETVTPKGSEKLVIEDIVIERTGEHVGVVNVPMERVRIPCGGKLQAGDMLRGPVRNRA